MNALVAVAAVLAIASAVVMSNAVAMKQVKLKVLVLGTVAETDATLKPIQDALRARGSPFDYINVLVGYQVRQTHSPPPTQTNLLHHLPPTHTHTLYHHLVTSTTTRTTRSFP